uniref:Uncharacterized protein n=1 Tax=Kalanchoe fedtschenkoi TaxID=63787 RepID=A0A7N0U1G4_KALFE
MTNDTATDPSYWLNWRFSTCAASLLLATVGASFVIWKCEGGESAEARVGSALSVNRCCVYCAQPISEKINFVPLNAERSTLEALQHNARANILNTEKCADVRNASSSKPTAGFLGYSFQVFFQVAAGAAMLSDFVFWFLVYPFHLRNSSRLDFLVFSMHFFNVVFLIGDAFLNSLGLAYFALWSNIYVIFQWSVHACFSMWWPYPFMDLSSPYAPAWYLAIGYSASMFWPFCTDCEIERLLAVEIPPVCLTYQIPKRSPHS